MPNAAERKEDENEKHPLDLARWRSFMALTRVVLVD